VFIRLGGICVFRVSAILPTLELPVRSIPHSSSSLRFRPAELGRQKGKVFRQELEHVMLIVPGSEQHSSGAHDVSRRGQNA